MNGHVDFKNGYDAAMNSIIEEALSNDLVEALDKHKKTSESYNDLIGRLLNSHRDVECGFETDE